MDTNLLANLQAGTIGRLSVSPATTVRWDDGKAFISCARGAIRVNDARTLQVLHAFAAPRAPRKVFDELQHMGRAFLFSNVAALCELGALIEADEGDASEEQTISDDDAASAVAAADASIDVSMSASVGVNADAGEEALAASSAAAARDYASEIALTIRSIACDLAAFGTYIHRRPPESAPRASITSRLGEVRRALSGVAAELNEARAPYLAAQVASLCISDTTRELKLNLGSGAAQLEGWIGVDLPPAELALHLGWRLPFADESVAFIYCSHTLEHLYKEEAVELLREAHRVLAPAGVVRLVVPDVEASLRAYAGGDEQYFSARRKLWSRSSRTCATPLELILKNVGAGTRPDRLWGHKYGYDFETLAHVLREAGFACILRSGYMKSPHAALRIDTEGRTNGFKHGDDYFSLFVEATK